MRPLRIALDPALKEARGPELAWTWRTLLTAAGHPWVEVRVDEDADIAHVAPGTPHGSALIELATQFDRWTARAPLQLVGVDECDGWPRLAFAGDPPPVGAPHDVAFDAFWLATAQAESMWPRNRHGALEADQAFRRDDVFTRALASQGVVALEAALARVGVEPGVPRWPNGRRAAAALTHDVDYPEVIRWLEPARVLARSGLRAGARPALDVARGRLSTWRFDSWLRLEAAHGARSAFYFVARKGSLREYVTSTPDPFYDIDAPRFRALFRHLTDQGAEVGLHASYRAYESAERFAAERAKLEAATGAPVVGNRHHYLHLDPDHPEETLLLHEQLGFRYDSTLGHERYLGWRNGLAWPFFPFHQRERRELDTLQLPFAWMDSQLFDHAADNPGDPAKLLAALADRAQEQAGCLVVNIHEYVFEDVLFPGWSAAYAGLLEDLSSRGAFWIDTPAAIAEHWRARADSVVAASRGLDQGARGTAAD